MSPRPYKYDPQWVTAYYDEGGEKEWERLTRTPVDEISLHLHTELLRENIRHGMKILEVGAASGRFTEVLAGLGCRITVVDISEGQLDLNRKKARELNFASAIDGWHRLDMCAMTVLPDRQFDAVVCYGGPISYVFEKADQALGECARVLKTDGLFFCSVMALFGTVHRFLRDVLDLSPEQNKLIMDSGDLTPFTLPENKHWCHMFRSPEFRDLLERNRFQISEMSSAGFLSVSLGDSLTEIREVPEEWKGLLELEKDVCRQPGCWDTGTHLIAVCRMGGQA